MCEGIASQSLNMYPCFACGPDNIAVLRRAAIAMSHEILQFHTRENGSSLDNSKALALLFFTTRGPSSKQHLMRPQSPLLVICTYGSRHTARAINARWEYVPAVARSGAEAQRLCNHASIGRLTGMTEKRTKTSTHARGKKNCSVFIFHKKGKYRHRKSVFQTRCTKPWSRFCRGSSGEEQHKHEKRREENAA